MSKLHVHIDDAPLHSGHAVRGMGFYTKNLISSVDASKKVDLVTFQEAEIIHYPHFDLFSNTLKIPNNKKVVVTVPDVIPLIYPKIYQPGIKGKIALRQQKNALRKVNAVITISETSKKDIVRLLDVPAEKVFVTYLGPGNKLKDTKQKVNLKHEYVLYIGDINWNKNVNNLVKALNKNKMHGIIIGKQAKDLLDNPDSYDFDHPQLKHLKELYELLKNDNTVRVMGYLEEDVFRAVISQASIYCQPSFYEGFGLPLLEAMQVGLPIATAKTQALVEVAEDAAIYFDPHSVEDIADKLETLMNNKKLAKELINEGNKRIEGFSWDNTALSTIEVYEKVR